MPTFADIMKGGDEKSSSYGPKDEYSSYVSGLKSALGLDQGKAEQLAKAICGLVRYEQSAPEEEPEGEGPSGKGPALEVVLGMGKHGSMAKER